MNNHLSSDSATSDDDVQHDEKDFKRLYIKYVRKNEKLKYLLLKSQANLATEVRYVFKKDDDKKPVKKNSKKGSKKHCSK